MKSLILSVKPKWVAKILNGEKTIEVRKCFPKDYRGLVYIYCTKEKPRAILTDKGCVVANTLAVGGNSQYKSGYSLSGKVIARFWCDNVEEITNRYCKGMLIDSCLSNSELNDYLGNNNGYAIHITKLEIFDEPKELSEFKHLVKYKCETCPYNNEEETNNRCAFCEELLPVKKAPQNLMYIETDETR